MKNHQLDNIRNSFSPVDGRNLAPVDMVNTPLFERFYTSQVVIRFSSINSTVSSCFSSTVLHLENTCCFWDPPVFSKSVSFFSDASVRSTHNGKDSRFCWDFCWVFFFRKKISLPPKKAKDSIKYDFDQLGIIQKRSFYVSQLDTILSVFGFYFDDLSTFVPDSH